MKVTIAYVTGRKEPHVEWVTDEIERQAQPGDELELVVIDYYHRTPDELGLGVLAAPWKAVRVHPPKPTIWQGPHRVTSCEWWAMSSARNTAFCLAQNDYIAFLDDCCKLGPEWLSVVRRGELERASVLMGTYYKYEDGKVSSDDRLTRWPNGRIDCGAGCLYGCTFALPLEWALAVNGFEEGCDSLSAEDYIFGQMLNNAGYRGDFVTGLVVHQERNGQTNTFKRTDKGHSPHDKSHAALFRFGRRSRTEFTPDLRELRRVIAAGGSFPIPDPNYEYRDWYDNQLVREM